MIVHKLIYVTQTESSGHSSELEFEGPPFSLVDDFIHVTVMDDSGNTPDNNPQDKHGAGDCNADTEHHTKGPNKTCGQSTTGAHISSIASAIQRLEEAQNAFLNGVLQNETKNPMAGFGVGSAPGRHVWSSVSAIRETLNSQ